MRGGHFSLVATCVAAALGPVAARAQAGGLSGMPMAPPPPAPSAASPGAKSATASIADMPSMAMGAMKGNLGAYPMTRDGSGTSWQPDSAPMEALAGAVGGWSTMVHAWIAGVYDNQGGARGGDKTFEESMLMAMGQRPLGGGALSLRAMLSLDPLMGSSGYPLLLAAGETANGRTLLVDRQHPHDLFMELAGVYSHPITDRTSAFLYAGLPGEPALGPVTFMHRFSGMANPEAPIDHHWLDSTHISFGVVTAGLVIGPVKLEASAFRGREPNQYRWDIETPRLDSGSVRATWNPTADWSLQVSRGYLKSPEQLTPAVDQDRTTASATYNRPLARGTWQTTFAWGRDDNRPGRTSDAFLLESAASFGRHSLFGRAETLGQDELFANQPTSPLYGRLFEVSKLSLGYVYTAPLAKPLAMDVGGLVSQYALPAALDAAYGSNPTSFMLFVRFKLR